MKKLIPSFMVAAAIFTTLHADYLSDCLSPDGSVRDCDLATGKDPFAKMNYFRKATSDPIATTEYLAVIKSGCDKGYALQKSIIESGGNADERRLDFQKAQKMCMNYGDWFFSEWDKYWSTSDKDTTNLSNKLDAALVVEKHAVELGMDGSKYEYYKNRKQAIFKEIEAIVEKQKAENDKEKIKLACTDDKVGIACVKAGIDQLNSSYPNVDKAAWFFRQGIQDGEPSAYYAFAGLFLNDLPAYPKDMSKITQLLDDGCKNGHHDSCTKLAKMYDLGDEGMAPNLNIAIPYYVAACKIDPSDNDSCTHLPIIKSPEKVAPTKKSKKVKK